MKRLGQARLSLLVIAGLLVACPASAADTLCDPSYQNCRSQLLTLIQNERIGIDVGFWFMQDARYATEIIRRWQAGVPVRILIDPRANPSYEGNAAMIAQFQQAGIPLRSRVASGILHWKVMLFAGQDAVEFGSANYSPDAFVPSTAYSNYVGETVFYTDDPDIVNSFKTKFDDSWTDTSNFVTYANINGPLSRIYPSYPIDPALNFPPSQDYANRAVSLYNKETARIDVIMYRLTDRRHTDAMISAHKRGVPIRMIIENSQYREPAYLWDAWNVDRLYAAGIPLRWRGHAGQNHEKLVLLYGQGLAIFGSSNWTTASANSQQEHNYFSGTHAIFLWFEQQFERMWNNTSATETAPFAPAPPDPPKYRSPVNASTGTGSTATLTWYGGPWAHNYDIYFGVSSPPPLLAANVNLGPSATTTTYQRYTTPSLAPGTTYYWKIVAKTMANVAAAGGVWSFTTSGNGGILLAGWSDRDIGSVGVAGGASYNAGSYLVAGSGADIWGTADAFHFAYKPLSGNGQLVARIASVANINGWSKAGVMVRDSLSPTSSYALMLVSAAKGSAFQYRAQAGAPAASITGSGSVAPLWVKIVRSGSLITGYQSSDGSSWARVGSASIALGSVVQIGLAITSHDNSRLGSASFDSVQ